jgi:hypothetical protein
VIYKEGSFPYLTTLEPGTSSPLVRAVRRDCNSWQKAQGTQARVGEKNTRNNPLEVSNPALQEGALTPHTKALSPLNDATAS